MKTHITITAGIAFIISLVLPIVAFAGGGKHLALNLIGSGAMYEDTVPDIDGDLIDDPAICFDVGLINVQTQQVIGTATDCLSQIVPTGTGLALIGTTTFHLPEGDLVTRGATTVQPVLHPTVTPTGVNITHITGASSDQNAILTGTRGFKNATGSVRLSGMVDMTNFAGNVGDPIVFDCLFLITLD